MVGNFETDTRTLRTISLAGSELTGRASGFRVESDPPNLAFAVLPRFELAPTAVPIPAGAGSVDVSLVLRGASFQLFGPSFSVAWAESTFTTVPVRLAVEVTPVTGVDDTYDVELRAPETTFTTTVPFGGNAAGIQGSATMTLTTMFVGRGRLSPTPLPPAPLSGVVVQDSFPLMQGGAAVGWQARARELTPTNDVWSLRVFATCVDRP